MDDLWVSAVDVAPHDQGAEKGTSRGRNQRGAGSPGPLCADGTGFATEVMLAALRRHRKTRFGVADAVA
jgi:hypothetical protein